MVSSQTPTQTFQAIKSEWFLQYIFTKFGCVKECSKAETKPDFAKSTLLGSSLPKAFLPEINGSS